MQDGQVWKIALGVALGVCLAGGLGFAGCAVLGGMAAGNVGNRLKTEADAYAAEVDARRQELDALIEADIKEAEADMKAAGLPLNERHTRWPLMYSPESLSFANGRLTGIIWNASRYDVRGASVIVAFKDDAGATISEGRDYVSVVSTGGQWKFSVQAPRDAVSAGIVDLRASSKLGDPRDDLRTRP